jgi:hypothetical protein
MDYEIGAQRRALERNRSWHQMGYLGRRCTLMNADEKPKPPSNGEKIGIEFVSFVPIRGPLFRICVLLRASAAKPPYTTNGTSAFTRRL